MDELGVYVVRVYRKDDFGMAGLVESVASGEQLSFRTTEELWSALRNLPSPRRQVAQDQLNQEGQT
jgi:hypothetical protein